MLYNYEVSIYEELHGSNDWNGSVLAAMLLVGSLGALLPSWLRHDQMTAAESGADGDPLQNAEPGSTIPVAEKTLAVRLTVVCALSSIVLVLCIGSWRTLPTVACLCLFFGLWQYVNVTVYARLALQLKIVQQRSLGERKRGPGLSVVSGLDDSTLTSPQTPRESETWQQHTTACDFDIVDTSNAYSRQAADHLPPPPIDTSTDQAMCEEPSPFTVHSPMSMPNTAAHLAEDEQPQRGAVAVSAPHQEVAEPPYSIAVVSIVAACVLVQIVLQIVLFSWLRLDLRRACYILVFVFCAVTILYGCFALFGLSAERRGLSTPLYDTRPSSCKG